MSRTLILIGIVCALWAATGCGSSRGPDADGDGESNADDACRDTPAGVAVDGYGCSSAQNAEQLARAYNPVLQLDGRDYAPEDVRVFVDSSLRPGAGAEAQLRLEQDAPAVDDDPTLADICDGAGDARLYLDLPGEGPAAPSEALDEPAFLDRYDAIKDAVPDTTYARLKTGAGRTALQYWFFYYYNDWWNDHEGDWEQVTLVFDSDDLSQIAHGGLEPARVGYGAHSGGTRRLWSTTEVRDGRPVVYVGLGSHANYFSSGDYRLPLGIDYARGSESPALTPVVLPQDPATASCEDGGWLRFAGSWGQTVSLGFFSGPRGPAFQGPSWDDPAAWVDSILEDWPECGLVWTNCRAP